MNFYEKIDIENNIVKYVIRAKYNEELTDDETMEIESLHDYIHKVNFADIDFTANITMINGTPTVTEDNVSESVVEVSLGKIYPKEYVLDENFDVSFSIDAGRISDSEINSVLTTKSLASQAKIAVFQAKIKERITEILDELRTQDNDFEKESETIL